MTQFMVVYQINGMYKVYLKAKTIKEAKKRIEKHVDGDVTILDVQRVENEIK